MEKDERNNEGGKMSKNLKMKFERKERSEERNRENLREWS